MPFSKENQGKITRNMESIVSDLKLNSILDTLIAKDVFKLYDLEKINSKDTQSERNREFVTLLVKAKPEGYEIFIDTLKKDDAYAELAQQIEKTEVPEEIEKTLEDWIGKDLLTSETGQHYPKDVDLLQYSRAIIPSNINAVAVSLGISNVDVQNIEYKHRSPESMCHELLIKWRNKTGHSATVRSLLEKLFQASSNNNTIDVDEIRKIL